MIPRLQHRMVEECIPCGNYKEYIIPCRYYKEYIPYSKYTEYLFLE